MGDEKVPQVVGEPRSKKWIFISIGIVVVIGILIGVFFMVGGSESEESTQTSEQTQLEKDLEKIDYAQQNKDPATCAEISDNASRHNCYMTMAYYLRDPSLCGEIPGGYYKLFCEKWKDGEDYTVNTTRTVWASMPVNFDLPYDGVDFKYRFTSNADGYAIVLLGEKMIGAINGSVKELGKTYTSDLLMLDTSVFVMGEHLLSIIVVPLSEEKSEFSIEDFTLYQLEE